MEGVSLGIHRCSKVKVGSPLLKEEDSNNEDSDDSDHDDHSND